MKCGDIFQKWHLKYRLDSKKKKYRQVYLCEGKKEVITIYERSITPNKMCSGIDKLPLEYQWYLRYKDTALTGLPRLLGYGYNDSHVWMITEYLPLSCLADHLKDREYQNGKDLDEFEAYVCYMKTFFMANPLLNQTLVPLCITPENISFANTEDGLSCYLTGLDTMLFPAYGEFKPEVCYDTRYLAPEMLHGEYTIESISYSFALSVLFPYKNEFPFPVPDRHDILPAAEMVGLVQACYGKLDSLGLPESMYRQFNAFLNPDEEQRAVFYNENDELRRMCGIEQTPSSEDIGDAQRMKMMMDAMNSNPFQGCFKRTEGKGLYDVGGMKEIKTKIQSVLYLVRHPEYAKRFNLNLSNICLVGPPGSGKSFFAKKIAEQLDRPSYLAHTSDIVGSYHGDNARSIRNLFQAAEESAPCILILDEVDCAAQRRNADLSPGALETCNELLVQINECNKKGILVVATTNSIENIDPAFLRSGRFDIKLYIGYPDDAEKESILRCVMRDRKNDLKDNDYCSLVRLMNHFVAADIASVAERASEDALIKHANETFRRFLDSIDDTDEDKIGYLEYIDKERDTVSEESFDTWSRVMDKTELRNVYLDFVTSQDADASSIVISYEMLERRIKDLHPSSSTQLEKEYAQKYQDFLPEGEKTRSRIGFNVHVTKES